MHALQERELVKGSSSSIGKHIVRKLYLLESLMSASVTLHGRGGTHACTAGEKGLVLMSFSSSSTSVSVSLSPIVPRVRT